MSTQKQPAVRFVLLLEKVPAGSGTNTYRWSTRPYADAGAWTEGRLIKWGQIDRGSSTPDGDYDICTTQVEIDDSDGLIRGLLADPTTRTFTSRESAIETLSETARAAGLSWRTITRGRVTGIQANPRRKATLKMADVVGSHFSGFDLEKDIGVRITAEDHPNAPESSFNRIYPIILGEHTDVGVVDENGDPADRGMLPVIDVGDVVMDSAGEEYDNVPIEYVPVPTNLQGVVNGTAGTTFIEYELTATSAYGETPATGITLTTGPDTLSGTDSVTLTWDNITQEGFLAYRIYRRIGENQPFGFIAETSSPTYTDTGAAVSPQSPPSTNTAKVDMTTVDGATIYPWTRLILKIGAAADVQHLYAADPTSGEQPTRVRVTEDRYGTEFLVYGRPGWPHADPYIETDSGIRYGVAYARGKALELHRAGTVTIAWNGCGDDEVGDGSGDTITDAFPALQHFLNEYVLKNDGEGYRTGTFGPLETYSNGVAKLKTSAFASAQTLTQTWIGADGYQASVAIVEPTSLRDILRKFLVTFACHLTSNHHGQVYPFLIDDTTDVTTGRHYRDRIEVMTMASFDIDHEAVETKVTGHYMFDANENRFRKTDLVFEDAAASAAYFAPRERSVRQCFYTHDEDTFVDACSRHLTRYKVAPCYPAIETDWLGLEDENGTQIRLTHYDGLGVSGYDANPCVVLNHCVKPQAPESVILKTFDLGRILTSGLPLLGDKTTIAANLYDHTVFAGPTSGAYELR